MWTLLGSPLLPEAEEREQRGGVEEGGHSPHSTGHGRGTSHCSGFAKVYEQVGFDSLLPEFAFFLELIL